MSILHTVFAHAAAWIHNNRNLNEYAQFLYLKTKLIGSVPGDRQNSLLFKSPPVQEGSNKNCTRVAFICDEMTWCDFRDCCDSIFLHPKLWEEQLRTFHPQILFCESAWSGIDAFTDVWRGRIYRDRRVRFENRDVLINILQYCRTHGITTVFWNKEDPAFFEHPIYDFTSTALMFDHVFTTDMACVSRYQAHGHKSVHVLPFGVNTAMFYPTSGPQDERSVFFAGSWFGNMPSRCKALEELLNYTLEQGWELTIYNRNSMRQESRFRFPEKYANYIREAVPFHKIPDIYRQYRYGININTVVDSPTMFSRRILQLAACGVTIITNDALALDYYTDCLKIWQPAEDGPIFIEGIPEAIDKHSAESRFHEVLDIVHVPMENAFNYV